MAIRSELYSPTLSMSFGREIEFNEMGLRKGNYTTKERRVEILFNYDSVRFMLQSNPVCILTLLFVCREERER